MCVWRNHHFQEIALHCVSPSSGVNAVRGITSFDENLLTDDFTRRWDIISENQL